MTVASARVTILDEVLTDPIDAPPPDGSPNRGVADDAQIRLLEALRAVQRGDFDVRLQASGDGVSAEIAETFNDIVEKNRRAVREVRRIQRTVGRSGRIRERASIGQVEGGW